MPLKSLKLSTSGINKILASPMVNEILGIVAENIADRARSEGIMVEHIPGDVILNIEVFVGGDGTASARVVIAHPSGVAVEAKDRLLGRSVDAGRIA